MTQHRSAAVTLWALLGSACGVALWSIFTTRTTTAAVEVVGTLTAVYALLALVVTSPSRDVPAPTSSLGCPAVLPGVPMGISTQALHLPAPRAAQEADA